MNCATDQSLVLTWGNPEDTFQKLSHDKAHYIQKLVIIHFQFLSILFNIEPENNTVPSGSNMRGISKCCSATSKAVLRFSIGLS